MGHVEYQDLIGATSSWTRQNGGCDRCCDWTGGGALQMRENGVCERLCDWTGGGALWMR